VQAGVQGLGGEVALHDPNVGILIPVMESEIFARFLPKNFFRNGALTDNLPFTVPNEHSIVAPSTTNSVAITINLFLFAYIKNL
jgi:hypothetical protein